MWCSKLVGQARFPAGPRAIFSVGFRVKKKGLSSVKKLKTFSLCHGGVVVKVVVLKAVQSLKSKERESIPSLGPPAL